MDWQNSLNGLQLDNDFITHDQIYLVSATELQALI